MHDMVNMKLNKLSRVFLDPLTRYFGPIARYVLPLFLKDRDHIRGRTAYYRQEQQLNRRCRDASFSIKFNSLSMSAGRCTDKKVAARILHSSFVIAR